jgi:hypothetical protein
VIFLLDPLCANGYHEQGAYLTKANRPIGECERVESGKERIIISLNSFLKTREEKQTITGHNKLKNNRQNKLIMIQLKKLNMELH